MRPSNSARVCVIGLGYVGLPLAVALAEKFETFGLDVNTQRIDELREGADRTGEIACERLQASNLLVTADSGDIPSCDFYIVTVPTPIDASNNPDLSIVESATRTVGHMIQKAVAEDRKPIVVFESTVYPGVTEELCAPLLEKTSKLEWKEDFFLAYSPERINPGDREHTIDKIVKVVSGDTPETLDAVAQLYGAVTSGGTYRAASIKVAEAAKVIENAQRDINIAFMNEVSQIFSLLDISIWDVLGAARTKWNFLPFAPGLVGGHCIGVDPYYLSYRASKLGHEPHVILSGRAVNDGMAEWVARQIHDAAGGRAGNTLVLGLSFKEDVPDLRNSKVADLITALKFQGHRVTVHDPHVDAVEATQEYGLMLDSEALERKYDMVVLAVPHRTYLELGADRLRALVNDGGMLADLKGVLDGEADWSL